MTTRDTPFAPGTPCWVDLLTTDVDGAKTFYGALLGWAPIETGPDFGGYVNFASDGHLVAGMMANPDPAQMGPDRWSTYISVADIDASVAAATDAGATVIAAPMAVGDIGSMAVLQDPAGGTVGLWQPAKHTGFGKYNEPGSVTWDEYHSRNFDASSAFYEKVFGWVLTRMSDTDDFRYTTGDIDGAPVAGMMDSAAFLPAGVPSHWAVYFSVADADAASARIEELGGTLLRPVEDTPFGRLVDAVDPTGAPFKLLQPPPAAAAQ